MMKYGVFLDGYLVAKYDTPNRSNCKFIECEFIRCSYGLYFFRKKDGNEIGLTQRDLIRITRDF